MFFVKFGPGSRDPIWPVDIFLPASRTGTAILGLPARRRHRRLPGPVLPACLQKAHENAALVDFDFDILQDQIFDGIRDVLGEDAQALDAFRLQDAIRHRGRYG